MDSKSKKKKLRPIQGKSKKESEVRGENLLLNYTYYLDHYHNWKVALGFDPFSFEAKIVFHHHGRFPVSTSYSGWAALHSYLTNLKGEIITDTLPANQEELKKEYRIPVGTGSILLTYNELYKLFDLLDFFNIVMFHNNNASESVKEYYKEYVKKCQEKNVLSLSNEYFFIPSRSSYVHINYSRLYYEIPLYCSANIVFDTILF